MITFLKKVFVGVLAATGILWLPFDISSYIDPQHRLPVYWYFIALVVITLGITGWLLFNRRTFSHHFRRQGITFTIVVGDIFAFDDGAAISFSDTFDTEVSSELISKHSLQALFTKQVYNNDVKALDKDIKQALRKSKALATKDTSKRIGKADRYPLGTVLCIEKKSKRYYLIAISKMGGDGRAQSTQQIFHESLCNLWTCIENTADNETISIPVIGTGKARLYTDFELALKEILLSAYSYSRITRRPTNHLRFVINKHDAKHIDMLKLKDFVESLDTTSDAGY
ncbi:hypothetical protein KSF_085160 [Reticulibacter mediterranei]|uniref:Thoeris protein ThsA Macro domain-containing protein n=1 Tax=Reticulibacter mediterranei TaxID=2778369 RepID=A0A8J3N7C6_9CHLR|nr:macro domain-containing protein [Reticulibacter mediterranei]GHO98468.1 hypothetical protein KSF_085160 [Reticulibacter mediterranei]